MAFYTDSLVGVARASVPAPYHNTTRNWRQLFDREFTASGGPNADFPRDFAIALKPLAAGSTTQSTLLKGSMDYYVFTAPASGSTQRLQFTKTDGSPLSASLGAQLTVFLCPVVAGVCE